MAENGFATRNAIRELWKLYVSSDPWSLLMVHDNVLIENYHDSGLTLDILIVRMQEKLTSVDLQVRLQSICMYNDLQPSFHYAVDNSIISHFVL